MAKKRLLIADDDRLIHEVFTEYLGEEYDYLHAYNGVDALVISLEQVPDLVILDVAMPILDGRTVCKKLKELEKTKNVKVLIVSGKDEQFDRVQGFEVGADDYLGKPHVLGLLKPCVERLLR